MKHKLDSHIHRTLVLAFFLKKAHRISVNETHPYHPERGSIIVTLKVGEDCPTGNRISTGSVGGVKCKNIAGKIWITQFMKMVAPDPYT